MYSDLDVAQMIRGRRERNYQTRNENLIYAPFPLTDIHGRTDLVVNMRQRYNHWWRTCDKGENVEFTFTRIHDKDTRRTVHALS
jgi:hypothetical protein